MDFENAKDISPVLFGCTAVLIGLGAITGVGILTGAAMASALAGLFFSTRGSKEERVELVIPFSEASPAEKIIEDLAEFEASVEGQLPKGVDIRVERISRLIRESAPKLDAWERDTEDAFTVLHTANHYMPEAVLAYLKLDRDFANNRAVKDGKTSLQLLHENLAILENEMSKIHEAICENDAQALLVHDALLRERFETAV